MAIFAFGNMSRRIPYIVLLAIAVAAFAVADVLWGGNAGADAFILTRIRLPRVLTAVISGAALALGGLQMQSIFRNPLADPHIMGVSAGAGLGAATALLLGAGGGAGLSVMGAATSTGMTLAAAAFLGAALSGALVLAVSSRIQSSSALLIFGIMLGFIVNAIVAILQFSSNSESLKAYYSWAAGSFGNCSWPQVAIMGACLVIGIILAVANAKGLNIILFGDEYAELSGARTRSIRFAAMAGCCVMAGAVTAFCGPLGFVGIVAPHIARRISGRQMCSDHRRTIPATMLSGAGLCAAADLCAQLWSRWASPLPVGSTLAIIGIPLIFLILAGGRTDR